MTNYFKILAGAAIIAAAAPAAAVDFSFTGSLPTADTVQFFDFTVGTQSTVTLRTWSYAGGTNAAGQMISSGGFDPILALFALPGGGLVGENDDGGGNVPSDPVTGNNYDTFLQLLLDPGAYRVSVAAYSNFANGPNLSDGFGGGGSFDGRTNAWAFDVLNVNEAIEIPVDGAVPEPASWAMLIAGFGLVGATLRRRRQVTVAA
jgi:hypothetical protein